RRIALTSSRSGCQRKLNRKGAAFSGRRGVIDLAAMFIDDLQGVREPQTGAISLRAEQAHKQIARLLLGHAEAGVADTYPCFSVTSIGARGQVSSMRQLIPG